MRAQTETLKEAGRRARARLGALGLGRSRADTRGLYLDLLQGAITHTLYHPPDVRPAPQYAQEAFESEFRRAGVDLGRLTPRLARREGRDWPVYAPTMVGVERLRNVRHCVETVLGERVEGDLIEAGCWRGGVSIFMRGILAAHGVRDRTVWAADSFRGVPPPDEQNYPADAGDQNHTAEELAVSREEVERNFRRFGLLDEQVRFVEGWFKDTLPSLRGERFAVVRLDGDLYESTMDGLENLYPSLAVGGFLIVDDFAFPNCRAAVEDYRRAHGIREEIEPIDWTGAFWRRLT